MSDEEKEAIEILKLYFGDNPTLNITKYVNIVLNLIEKQTKEIEKLKEENKKLTDEYLVQRDLINPDFLKDYVSKDKIKAKIEVYEQDVKDFEEYWSKDPRKFKKEKSVDYYKLEALQSLLEKE